MSELGKEIAEATVAAWWAASHTDQGDAAIAAADAAIAPLVETISDLIAFIDAHDPLSKNNPYIEDLRAILARTRNNDTPRPSLGQHIAGGCGDD